jgi:hypothetical protein
MPESGDRTIWRNLKKLQIIMDLLYL